MNPILADIYATVLPSAPFIIAAYAILLIALFAYVFVVVRGLRKTEAEMAVLEETLGRQLADNAKPQQ